MYKARFFLPGKIMVSKASSIHLAGTYLEMMPQLSILWLCNAIIQLNEYCKDSFEALKLKLQSRQFIFGGNSYQILAFQLPLPPFYEA